MNSVPPPPPPPPPRPPPLPPTPAQTESQIWRFQSIKTAYNYLKLNAERCEKRRRGNYFPGGIWLPWRLAPRPGNLAQLQL